MGLLDAIAALVRAGYPEDTARKIASGDLDMRLPARLERQQDLYPTTAYHGGSDDILNIDVDRASTGKTRQTGFFMSENPVIASSYAGRNGNVMPLAVNTKDFDLVDAGSSEWNRIINPDFLIGGERLATVGDLPMSYSTRSPDTPLFDLEDIVNFDTDELARTSRQLGSPGIVFKDVADIGPNYRAMEAALEAQTGLRFGDEGYQQALDTLYGNTIVTSDPSRVRSLLSAAFDPDYTGPNILGGAAGTAALAGLLADPEEAEAGVIQRVIDPRFTLAVGAGGEGSIRKGLMDRIETMGFDVEDRPLYTGDTLSLADLEGRPYIITQSDRSRAGGVLTGIDGTPIDPVDLRGGRDFMFENPGMVWASDPKVVSGLMGRAEELRRLYGSNPILLPYSMAPTGIDYATMPLDTMINFARAEMSRTNKKKLDAGIRKIIPEWGGVDDPMSNSVFRDVVGDKRKAVEDFIDKNFRNERGGLSIAEARVATSSPEQFEIIDGGLLNIGEIDPTKPIIADSGHPTYLAGLPGMGLGRLPEVISVRPQMAVRGRDVKNDASDIRSLSMRPEYGQGQIDEELLRAYYGRATPEMLAATAAGTGAALAAPGLINMASDEPLEKPTAGDVMDSVFNILDMPMAGLQGLVRTGYGLATGESLLDALAEGVHITQQGPDYGADRFEQYITDKTGDPSLGWMGKMGLLFGAPF